MKMIDEHVWDVKKLSYPWIERGSVIDRVFWIDNYRAATKCVFQGKVATCSN